MDTRPGASAVPATGIGRRDVLIAGAGAALALTTLSESVEAAATAKAGWRFCNRCRGLFAGKGTRSVGVCPAGGSHTPVKAYSYLLLADLAVNDPGVSKNWFQCQKCRALTIENAGVCPKGGAHASTGPEYALWRGVKLPFMEEDWVGCEKCFGLVWAGASTSFGVCPAFGEHRGQGTVFNYRLIILQ